MPSTGCMVHIYHIGIRAHIYLHMYINIYTYIVIVKRIYIYTEHVGILVGYGIWPDLLWFV